MSKRKFNFVNEDRIEKLQTVQLKKSSESKCNWAVTAYVEWRNERLRTYNYDYSIYQADLLNFEILTQEDLCHSLCRFVPEVTKSRGEGLYPAKTLYQMVVAIQKYLWVNRIHWQLIEGIAFIELKNVLNNIMMERTKLNIGVVTKQAEVITFEFEQKLWELSILGEDTPDKLRDTCLFLLGINCLLRAVDEHYNLRRDLPGKPSQISFRINDFGEKCLVYQEDSVTKTHDGGLNDMRRERKTVWVYPNKQNVSRCPVRLVQKYINLCPKNYQKKDNFYLKGLAKKTPNLWYAEQVVGANTLSKVIKSLMKEADIQGYFTNHSARRTGGTRLFQAGVDRKLVKEATGHTSDAVDKYQITSDQQRREMSKILAGNTSNDEVICLPCNGTRHSKANVNESEFVKETDQSKSINVGTKVGDVGDMVNKIIATNSKKGKTVIRIEIEISNE